MVSTSSPSAVSILEVISKQRLGFKFGKPDRPSEKSLACILPILRETSVQRQYITLPETEEVLITDSGTINKINLENASKQNVYVRSSTMFEGKGTQSRVLSRSAVLFPGKKAGLECRCIHSSHPIASGNEFKYGGVSPLDVDSSTYTSGYSRADQTQTWNAVRMYSASITNQGDTTRTRSPLRQRLSKSAAPARVLRPSSPLSTCNLTSNYNPMYSANSEPVSFASTHNTYTENSSFTGADPYTGADNLAANFAEFAKSFDGILSKARLHDNQCGLALITETGCKTIECFDVPSSWEALHKDAVKRMGTELLRGEDKTSVFEYKPENAVAAVQKVLALDFKTNLIYQHKPSNGEPPVKIFGLDANRYTGEVVELDGRVIHMVILERAN